ncbi:hypothetical protein Tco_1009367, partial [Tanacetum coccineum]
MSTQQDIYAAGSENRPPMLNKENYVPWSSRLLRYAKSRPNGKLIYNSIMNGPYVRRMIPKPGDADCEDIYAVVDSCETAQEICTIKGVDDQRAERLAKKTMIRLHSWQISNNPFTIQCFTRSFSNHHQVPTCINHKPSTNNYNPQPSFNQNYMQQPMPNPEDITDPTTAMNMALILMAKAFKLNYSTPTNNNQRISSNPHNRQITQPGMNMGQRQMRMVRANGGNQFRQYAGQNVGNQNGNQNRLSVVPGIANQHGIGNIVAARAEDCSKGRSRDPKHSRGFDFMAAAGACEETERANANHTFKNNLQQASTSDTQFDKAPVYNSDGSTKVGEQNDSNVISEVSSMEQGGGTVEQHSANVEETRAYHESLFHNLAAEVEKVNSVNRKMKETNVELTTKLARYKNQKKCFEISQEKYDKLERCYQKSVYQEQCLTKKINALHLSSSKQITTLNEEISNLNKQLSKEKSTVSSLPEEKKKLKSD